MPRAKTSECKVMVKRVLALKNYIAVLDRRYQPDQNDGEWQRRDHNLALETSTLIVSRYLLTLAGQRRDIDSALADGAQPNTFTDESRPLAKC